jgi:hypothetical protein
MLRRAFLSIVSPSLDEQQNGPRVPPPSTDDKADPKRRDDDHDFTGGLPLGRLMHLFHRVLEAHTLMCQVIVLIAFSAIIYPGGYVWNALSVRLLGPGIGLHPHVELALMLAGIMQKLVIIPNIITLFYYYTYHQFAGFDRWALQPAALVAKSLGVNAGTRAFNSVLRGHRGLKVHALGKRPGMAAPLKRFVFIAEFAVGSVVAAICFFLVPLLVAQTCHLVTRELEYTVSEKPRVEEEVELSKEKMDRVVEIDGSECGDSDDAVTLMEASIASIKSMDTGVFVSTESLDFGGGGRGDMRVLI